MGHLVRNKRSVLSLEKKKRTVFTQAENARFSVVALLKFEHSTWPFGRKIAPKSVQHDYFSSFKQSWFCFVTLSLTVAVVVS